MHVFSEEENRIMANLDQVYDAIKEVKVAQLSMPRYMTWKTVSETKYLYQDTPAGEKSLGKESLDTIKIYDEFAQKKQELSLRNASMEKRINSITSQYRALKLPMTMALPAKILQEMDVCGLLEEKFLVVGSFGFAAYEMEAGYRFMDGIEETEDFDISWRTSIPSPGTLPVSASHAADSSPLLNVIKSVDKSFEVSNFSQHKLINKNAFEVDVLCSKGDHFKVEVDEKNKIFGGRLIPVEMNGQDILHMGKPLHHVAVGRGGVACPLLVPDPRCMAIHKLWLSTQPDRSPKKQKKDGLQAVLLWQQCHENMLAYPINDEFMASIPEKWQKVSIELSKKAGIAFAFDELLPETVESGQFSGLVLRSDNEYLVQKVGRDPDKTVRHDCSKLSRVPEVGEVVEIGYVRGVGQVSEKVLGVTVAR